MDSILPEHIHNHADNIVLNLLPVKSREKYLRCYNIFMLWKTQKKIDRNCFSEDVMLVYFDHLKSKYALSTLWVDYLMLRETIQRNHDVDINYAKLHTFLNRNSVGYEPKKSNVFQANEVRRVLTEADDI